ncbi:replication factor-a protein [Coccomyxa subellipsoidea C-169]|uniref:Replication protein A subunit n=1 Tax=Coccomyxa subellipsoidea (strain C-169) TaxID=574566 RepID=I0YPW7_COCSC|nr:replication factor-a protein [Coccomyxa subellipsoidea C-169]EIE20436.1 replication factor-a protein [Coccomyxa subellipsoidea C-169]|eukprot:XP_005644980.1 replication factor-a protein [Coccomyxa subellipsoidea C-169]
MAQPLPPLSAGAVQAIADGAQDIKAVVQIIGVKPVPNKGDGKQRHRLALSDGQHWITAIPATQLDDLVTNQVVVVGSVIRLEEYLFNNVNNRQVLILLQLDNLGISDKMADATEVGKGQNSGGNAGGPAPLLGGAGSGPYAAINGEDAPLYEADMTACAAGGYGGGGGGGGGGYGQNGNYKGHGPIARNEAPPRIVPISSLNSYQSHWTIKARITNKSEIRRYSNAPKCAWCMHAGKLFSFELLDAQGGEIRGCGFNQCVDKFEPIMQQGAVIMMSKASLKNKKPGSAFNNTRHDYEITLEPNTVIEVCEEDERAIPKMQYHFIKVKELNDKFANETVDIIGIVDKVDPSAVIQTREGKELMKRNISIRDDSGASVEITLWGTYSSEPGDQLEEVFNGGVHSVLALKNAKIGDYNGRTLSTVSTTTLTVDPDVPEAGHLRHWFDSAGGAAAPVSALTSGSGASVGGGKGDRRVTLATIKEEALGTNSTNAWVQIVCTITFVKSDPIAYPACTLQYNGKQCNKKVTDSGGGDGPNRWWCERCSAACEAEYRYMLNLNIEDHSGKEWVTAFQEEGKQIIGYTANEMQELKEAESPLFEARLNDVKCRSYLFKLKVSEDTWQDEQRIRINVVR